jgi:hypothetical protein
MSTFTANITDHEGNRLVFKADKDSKKIDIFIGEDSVGILHVGRPILSGSDVFNKAIEYLNNLGDRNKNARTGF